MSLSVKHLTILALLSSCVSGPAVKIHDLSSDQLSLCPGDQVVLTCQTRGSQTIEWRSDEYTDSSYLLKFAAHDHIGRLLHSPTNSDIVANFTNSSRDENELIMLESQLSVRVGSNSSSPSVKCLIDNLEMDIITLRVLVNPMMGDVISDQSKSASGGCLVYVSWTVPDGFFAEEIRHFMVYLNDTQMDNELLKNKTVVMKGYHVCTCDVHTIKISAVDVCSNVGKNISISVESPDALSDMECREEALLPADSASPNCNRDVLIVGWVVSGVLLFFTLIIGVALVVSIFNCKKKNTAKKVTINKPDNAAHGCNYQLVTSNTVPATCNNKKSTV